MARRSIAARAREALAFVRQLAQEGKNWVEAQNAVCGPAGKCTELFPTREEREAFMKTRERRAISQLLAALPTPPVRDETRPLDLVAEDLHIRLPHALAEALRTRARAEGVELNHLILTNLSEVARPAAAESARPRKKRA
jgi:hypothetical protein